VSDSAADTIVDIAAIVGASYVILGKPERNMLINLLRGSIKKEIAIKSTIAVFTAESNRKPNTPETPHHRSRRKSRAFETFR
jgi:hypothetical protein